MMIYIPYSRASTANSPKGCRATCRNCCRITGCGGCSIFITVLEWLLRGTAALSTLDSACKYKVRPTELRGSHSDVEE